MNTYSPSFPDIRMRRTRRTPALRNMMQEHRLHVHDLILPLFVEENITERAAIASLPGVYRDTKDTIKNTAQQAFDAGLQAILLFGVSHNKDHDGTDTMNEDGLLARTIRALKSSVPDLAIIADVCFCEYTDHGHCGPLNARGDVNNDRTLINLGKQAVNLARAGADIIAPSGMMDGMVMAIRSALDEADFIDIPVMSYAAKFSSNFYGPFRDAAGCSLSSGTQGRSDRKTYQMNPANAEEAMRETALDINEGADMIIVKPGLPYLDIIRRIKGELTIPTFAYHVSGEFAMLKAAAEKEWLNYEDCLMESLLSFKRAGCNGIITYGALDAARIMSKK